MVHLSRLVFKYSQIGALTRQPACLIFGITISDPKQDNHAWPNPCRDFSIGAYPTASDALDQCPHRLVRGRSRRYRLDQAEYFALFRMPASL